MMNKNLYLILLIIIIESLCSISCYSLSTADFVPKFLKPNDESGESVTETNAELPLESLSIVSKDSVKPLVNKDFNYKIRDSVIKDANLSNNGLPTDTLTSKVNFSKVNLPLNTSSTSNSNSYLLPNAKLEAFKDQRITEALEKTQEDPLNRLSFPVNPSKDVNMNFNLQQLEINIKY